MQFSLATLSLLTSAVFCASSFGSKPYQQEALDQYNVLRFLGTASPYVAHPGYGISRDAPHSCNVTQAHVLSRHGERYPTKSKGTKIAGKLERIRNLKSDDITGPLAFLADYEFIGLDAERYDSETNQGPYSGLVDIYNFGALFRNRYSHLYESIEDKERFKFYTASQERVVVSAFKFAEGFLGSTVNESSVIIIDEDDDTLGANSLTPSTSCVTYNTSIHDEYVEGYSDSFKQDIADRFNNLSPELNITKTEVGGLLEYAGFDLNVAGFTNIVELFTTSELLSNAYANDLDYYYNKGPGNNLSAINGAPYVDAILNLTRDDDVKLTISFAHDSDLFPVYTVLGLFDGDLPLEYIDFNGLWKSSNLAPMGGHIVFERLECEDEESDFLRILVNDAVIPIPGLSNGPGYSAAVDDVEAHVLEKLDGQSYAKDCGLNEGSATSMTFFWEN